MTNGSNPRTLAQVLLPHTVCEGYGATGTETAAGAPPLLLLLHSLLLPYTPSRSTSRHPVVADVSEKRDGRD